MKKRLKQFIEDVDTLMARDSGFDPDLDTLPPAGVNPDAWDRHWDIVCAFGVAKESMHGVEELRYTRMPDKEMDTLTTTLTMGVAATLSHDAITALALAAALSDTVTETVINGKLRINFSVSDVWAE